MRGIPNAIRTPADLNNLFVLARDENPVPVIGLVAAINTFTNTTAPPQPPQVDKPELVGQIRRLLRMQYHRVPIMAVDGAAVTTRYFPEVAKGGKTEDGLTVKSVEHIEAEPEEGESADVIEYELTKITLSAAPKDEKELSIYLADNHLTRNGFDVGELTEMLEVLNNA